MTLSSCSKYAKTANECMENGTLKIGSTYEQLVEAAGGEPKMIESDEQKDVKMAAYADLFGDEAYFLLKKNADGKFVVDQHFTDKYEAAAVQKKYGLLHLY